ncbi:MAG: SPFH domain-containing protein [Lentisphaeria bacterium]
MKTDNLKLERLAWLAAVTGAAGVILTAFLAGWSGAAVLWPPVVAAVMVALTAVLAGVRLRLARREAEEADAVADYRTAHAGTELFAEADEAFKLAARSHRLFAQYAQPILAGLLGAAMAGVGLWLWRAWAPGPGAAEAAGLVLRPAVLAVSLFVAALIAGSYFSGASRDPGGRPLRPAGAWLILTAVLLLFSGAVLLAAYFHPAWTAWLRRAARGEAALLLVLGAEVLFGVIVDWYRPRSSREEERPSSESRLLALVTEPGGLARNVAAALDYQFGFRVSEAWFYRFLERAVVPFAVLAAAAFWLLTCFEVIGPSDQGLLLRCGRLVSTTPLEPGLHLKLPWPFDRMLRFPVRSVQEIDIGFVAEDATQGPRPPADPSERPGDLTGRIVVWSKAHVRDETNFVVACRSEQDGSAAPAMAGRLKQPVSVYFMSASIPLYYKVSDLPAWLLGHQDARRTLEETATREVVRYLANVDFFSVLCRNRSAGGEELRRRIQAAADQMKLGVEVVSVGLQGLHPPVRAGKAFDGVVAAMEEGHSDVLKAQQAAVAIRAAAEGEAVTRKTLAQAYREERIRVAAAEAGRFEKQMAAYRASPALFRLNSFLDLLETAAPRLRQFVVATGANGSEVTILNLEKKLRPDLLDLNLDAKEK